MMADKNVLDALPVVNGLLTIDGSSAPGNVLADQLARCTNGSPVVIRDAVRTAQDGAVVVKGKTDFLGAADVGVTASAASGSSGSYVVTLRFNLIEGAPGPNAWKFSRSFPNLPGLYAARRAGARPHVLDTLVLSDAAFVITTGEDGTDAATGAPLQAGLNFVSLCTPTGMLGLLGSLLTGGGAVPLYGTVVIPKPTELTVPVPSLPLFRFPWQMPGPIPGINLVADLGVDKSLGQSLRLHTVGLRIYTPTSKVWAGANPTYAPALVASAKLDLPSADISLDLSAIGVEDPDSLLLFGLFDGVSVGKLANLVDVAGADDLAASLPQDVRSVVDTVGKLSLQGVSIQLGSGFSVEEVGLSVGIPDLNTKVLPGFTVDSLLASFSIYDPFGPDRALSAVLGGVTEFADTPFDIAVSLPQVEARARLRENLSLPLGRAFDGLGGGLPTPSDLVINQMQFDADKTGAFYFAAAAAQSPPWTLDLGPTPLTVSDVTVLANRPGGGGASSASFSAVVSLGDDLKLAYALNTPGDFRMRAELPEVRLMQLVGGLTNQAASLPGNFDLTFKNSTVLIQSTKNDLVFQLATTMEDLGTVAFEARRTSAGQNTWGFAAGVDLTGLRLSSLPGLGALKAFEDVFKLDELLVVVASFDDPNFMFPGLAAFNSPTIRAGNLTLPAQAGGVVRGFNAYARWTIDTSSREQKMLSKFLGLNPSLGVTLQVGANPSQNSRLYVSYDTTIQGHPFSCKFGGQIKDGQVGLFLTGTLQAQIQKQLVRFDVTMLLVANGAFFSGSMLGSITFEGITLSNLALVIGVSWEAIPSLGIAATLGVGKFQSSLAIFFDSTDPSRSLLAGSVSDLSLRDVLDTFAGSVIPSDIDKALDKVALVGTSDFQISADTAAALDNLQVDAVSAAFAKAGVTIPSVSSQVLLNVSKPGSRWFLTDMASMLHYELVKTSGGIRVTLEPQFYCAPQTTFMGALRFDQGIFLNAGLEVMSFEAEAKVLVKPSKGVSVDGRMSRVVIGTESLFSIEATEGKQGPRVSAATFKQPELQDATLKNPHFLLDGSLTLLGLKQSVYVKLTDKGFNFLIKGALKPGPKYDLPGDFAYDLNGRFNGPKDLGAGGSLSAAVGAIDLGKLGKVKVDSGVTGQFDAGVNGSDMFAKFAGGFELAGEKLTLPKVDLDVKTASLLKLPRRLADMVKDALNNLLKDAAKWAKLVRGGVITGVADVGAVLKSVYNKTADEAAKLLKDAGYTASEIGATLKSAYGATAQQVAQLLKGAGFTIYEISSTLKSVYGATAQQAAQFLRGAGYTAEQVGGALKSVYSASMNQAAQLLKGAGYTVNQVGGALKSAYGATAATSAAALKAAGYAVDEVGAFVKNTYKLGAKELESVLKGAGYTTNQIKGFFNSLGGEFKDFFDDVGDKLDPTKW
jgi:sugar phosphate isomerase/epimerase